MKERDEKDWLEKIAAVGKVQTPFCLTDLDVIAEKAQLFAKLMPRVGIYYAVKSNSDPRIIETLKPLVNGFDIASRGEYELLQNLRISPERIVYSNPVKVPSHIQHTYEAGVRRFAFDSLGEIEKIKAHAPQAIVYPRIKVSDYGSKFPLSGKFGIDPIHLIDYAATAQEAGLQVKGLTFHVGSQAENVHVWDAALKIAGESITQLRSFGMPIEFLDIGGGFPASYEDLAPTINEVAEIINHAIKKYLPEDIVVFAEPGRYISANASVIGATVIGREHRNGVDWLYLDIGVFQGLIEPLEMSGWKYPILTNKSKREYKKSFVLTGPTCDAYDTLGMDYLLPADISIGDRIYIAAAGAYSLVYGSSFNGFEMPTVHYTNHGKGA